MNNITSSLTDLEIGERLRRARDAASMTQVEASSRLNIARTTLLAIEKGQRRVRLDEIQDLAKLYGTSANSLLREESVQLDLVPRFRKTIKSNDFAATEATSIFGDLVRAEVELEALLGVKRQQNLPPQRALMPGNVSAQAETDALSFRQWLGLAQQPIQDMITLLEIEMGVRTYVKKMDSRISGLFAYDERAGACMLFNASHPRERINQTAAHETGHLIASRELPEVLFEGDTGRAPEEQYASKFGRALLTPARAVMQKFSDLTAGASKLTRRHIIVLAHSFGVSREAMVRRLEELELAKRGTWDWFQQHGGISNQQAQEVLGFGQSTNGEKIKSGANALSSLRLAALAAEAWRREILSEGQLSSLLRIERSELRAMFASGEIDRGLMDDE